MRLLKHRVDRLVKACQMYDYKVEVIFFSPQLYDGMPTLTPGELDRHRENVRRVASPRTRKASLCPQ